MNIQSWNKKEITGKVTSVDKEKQIIELQVGEKDSIKIEVGKLDGEVAENLSAAIRQNRLFADSGLTKISADGLVERVLVIDAAGQPARY